MVKESDFSAHSSEEMEADRAAIEFVVGHSMTDMPWPSRSLPPGTRVRVIQDSEWAGPWAKVFAGTIDQTITPRLVMHPAARAGEFEYAVRFDEPQMDADGDGPYRKAVIWDRYLVPFDS